MTPVIVAIRGIVRPDSYSCIQNLITFWEHEKHLASRLDKESEKLALWMNDSELVKDVPIEGITANWKTKNEGHWKPQAPFMQVALTNAVLNLIGGINNPWVVLTRPDLYCAPGPIERWMNEGCYTMPQPCCYPSVNDQFAVARLDILKKAWDWGDFANQNRLLDGCENPEGALGRNLSEKGIKTMRVEPVKYELRR
jgi:hypothetical protein